MAYGPTAMICQHGQILIGATEWLLSGKGRFITRAQEAEDEGRGSPRGSGTALAVFWADMRHCGCEPKKTMKSFRIRRAWPPRLLIN
ncbi:hypothetical protein NHX12_005269 [Muraenolepis orangiensis]|uniref:Uncharacterized protein n=1 Tax=Muraenolepis orangiensis TaxID=630683 RepID=A0A9Q0IDJ7_9TELE|nr:hypothetical protein NHX12_005269 [Muraenolepis orangiensis]